MLTDFQQVKAVIGVPPTDTSQDAKIQLLTVVADGTVKSYCKQLFEFNAITEYPILLGGTSIVLNEKYVQCFNLPGNITNGQPTITGLPSTSNLFAGMPVVQAVSINNSVTTQPFPNGVTIQSVNSSSQVTLTGTCTAVSQTGVSLIFGLAAWWDPNGSFGDGIGSGPSGPFGANSLLRQGLDFAFQRDNPNDVTGNVSKSGKLICLDTGFTLLGSSFFGGIAAGWGAGNWIGSGDNRGGLSAYLPPRWPRYPAGSIKVVYAAGLGVGAVPPNGLMPNPTTIPPDLTAATSLLAAWMWRNADTGGMQYQSESYQGYSANLAMQIDAAKQPGELGSIRQILSRYRRLSI